MVESANAAQKPQTLKIGREFSFGGDSDRRDYPQIHVNSDSDDEFYDALENTQALHQANKADLNSPTLRLMQLYNRMEPESMADKQMEQMLRQSFEGANEDEKSSEEGEGEEDEDPMEEFKDTRQNSSDRDNYNIFGLLNELSPGKHSQGCNSHRDRADSEQLEVGQTHAQIQRHSMVPTACNRNEFGSNFFFIKKGNRDGEEGLEFEEEKDSSEAQKKMYNHGQHKGNQQISRQTSPNDSSLCFGDISPGQKGNNHRFSTFTSSTNQASGFSLPCLSQTQIQQPEQELNSYCKFVQNKNVNGRSKLIPDFTPADVELSPKVEPDHQQSSNRKHRKKKRGEGEFQSQSQIIYNNQQKSNLVQDNKPDAQIQFEESSQSSGRIELETNMEEQKGATTSSLNQSPFSQTPSSLKRPDPEIKRVQSVAVKKPYRELNDLQNLHHFSVSDKPIWVIKFRQDGKYLATGGMDGVLRVYQMLPVYSNERQTATFFETGHHQRIKPFKEFANGHKLDIFDINWCPKEPYENYLLTAGVDKKIIIWNLNDRGPIQELAHLGIVSCAIFNVTKNFCIASGCSDKTIRLWRINTRQVTNWQQTPDFITALQFNHAGSRLIAGLINGVIHIYDSQTDSLQHLQKIECRNRTGKFSKGRKVTGIEFMSGENMPSCMMVTTNDSRIRFINIKNGKVLLKIKGHKNEHFVSRASLSSDYAHAICASEDGAVYLWNNIEQSVLESSKRGLLSKILKTKKIKEYEYFSMSQQNANSELSNQFQSLNEARRQSSCSSDSSYSGQSPKTNYGSTTSSAIGTGNISLCQAVFAPQCIIDNLNGQKDQNGGIIDMIMVVSNLRGEVSILMNQTRVAQL